MEVQELGKDERFFGLGYGIVYMLPPCCGGQHNRCDSNRIACITRREWNTYINLYVYLQVIVYALSIKNLSSLHIHPIIHSSSRLFTYLAFFPSHLYKSFPAIPSPNHTTTKHSLVPQYHPIQHPLKNNGEKFFSANVIPNIINLPPHTNQVLK